MGEFGSTVGRRVDEAKCTSGRDCSSPELWPMEDCLGRSIHLSQESSEGKKECSFSYNREIKDRPRADRQPDRPRSLPFHPSEEGSTSCSSLEEGSHPLVSIPRASSHHARWIPIEDRADKETWDEIGKPPNFIQLFSWNAGNSQG